MFRITTQRRWIWTYRCAMWSTVVRCGKWGGRLEIFPFRTYIAASKFTGEILGLLAPDKKETT